MDRPTLDESWYRIAQLTLRLRSTINVYRQTFRGRQWHILHDPSSNKFFRLHEPQYRFVALLNGRRPVDEAWQIASDQLGDAAPTQGEAIRVLGQLYTSNLLEAALSPDSERLFERYRRRRRQETQSYIMSVLFARIPLVDPNRILDRWEPLVGWLFGPVGFLLWLALGVTGLIALSGRLGDLWDQSAGILTPANLPLLYAAIALTKLIHEFGHGFACKHFGKASASGGDVHTLGIMFMALIPVPYVDASTAWALRSKWHRAIVGAAGMYAELAVAAVAAIAWANSSSGTVTHALAYNIMAVTGVSTLLFNANPLVRFDGYYILADLAETPNLSRRSNQFIYFLVQRFAWGHRRAHDPSDTTGERPWLVLYSISAFIYRTVLIITIILFVGDKLFFIGPAMAVMAVVGFLLWPAFKFTKFLLTGRDIVRVRSRAMFTTILTIAALAVGLGMIPVREHGRAEGLIEARTDVPVFATTDGWLQTDQADARPGSSVHAGASLLFVLASDELRFSVAQSEADLARLRSQRDAALPGDVALADAADAQIQAVRARRDRLREELASAEVIAQASGAWRPTEEDLTGQFVRRGTEIGRVVSLDELEITVTADQFLGPRLEQEVEIGSPVEIMVAGEPGVRFQGRLDRVLPVGRRDLPSSALGITGGGGMMIDQSPNARQADPGTRAAEAFFEVVIEIDPDTVRRHRLRPGQTVHVRIPLEHAPIAEQGYRRVRQVLQRRFNL